MICYLLLGKLPQTISIEKDLQRLQSLVYTNQPGALMFASLGFLTNPLSSRRLPTAKFTPFWHRWVLSSSPCTRGAGIKQIQYCIRQRPALNPSHKDNLLLLMLKPYCTARSLLAELHDYGWIFICSINLFSICRVKSLL